MKAKLHYRHGLTLVEIMIAMVIITVGLLSFIGSFGNIAKAIRYSKSRTIANNLAQEKIEFLKNISYHRLLVTNSTSTATESGLGSFVFDDTYYPPETVTVGDIQFVRRVYVEKVTESGGTLSSNNWQEDDTGLKRIFSYVIWQEQDDWKKLLVANLRDNPNRQSMNSTISGTVESSGDLLEDAVVFTLQNVELKDSSESDGSYSISVSSGEYELKATKRGYFPQTQEVSVGESDSATVNFDLTEMATGKIVGQAYLNSHLLISRVSSGDAGDAQVEYVELYNPTAEDITLEQGGSDPTYLVRFKRGSDSQLVNINVIGKTIYVNTDVPAYGYFLIASSPAVYGVTADAYYSNGLLVDSFPEDRIPNDPEFGGVALVSRGVYEVAGTTVDAVGWGLAGGPSGAKEGNGVILTNAGLLATESLERVAYSSSTINHALMDKMPVAGIHVSEGNAYDSGDNLADWVHHNHGDNVTPLSSADQETPGSGTPIEGAVVFSYDGLSSSTMTVDSPITGLFVVTDVATGTWTVLLSSQGYFTTVDDVTVTDSGVTLLSKVVISTPAETGFIIGRVIDSGNNGLATILVSASGSSDVSDTDGYFLLEGESGTYTVVANPDNDDSDYTIGEATGVAVTVGALTNVGDIQIFSGGAFNGFVTTNGTDPLPGIPIVVISSATGAEVGSFVSDSLGEFSFANLRVGEYTLTPQLEDGESSSPSSLTDTVVAGSSVHFGTFTITNAFGTIVGSVTANGKTITTGVLIAATPDPNTLDDAGPPDINSALRSGSDYYYFGSSGADGTYSISLRGGETYNVKAWFTEFSGGNPITTPQSGSASVSAGGSATINFTW